MQSGRPPASITLHIEKIVVYAKNLAQWACMQSESYMTHAPGSDKTVDKTVDKNPSCRGGDKTSDKLGPTSLEY